jgi:hypothetical protein
VLTVLTMLTLLTCLSQLTLVTLFTFAYVGYPDILACKAYLASSAFGFSIKPLELTNFQLFVCISGHTAVTQVSYSEF